MPHSTVTADGHEQRGLILDFAGVLTAGPGAVHREWCVSEGLEPGAWRAALNDHPEGRRLYAALEIGELGQAEWNEGTAALLGEHVDPVNLMGRAWAEVPPARRMIALARAARAAGHRLALLSNSFGLDPFNPYEHVGIWDLFDVHVVSELEGLAKPDPAIYRLALERIGLPAERCVFVDDREKNLPPAAELGITTVHVTDEDTAVAELEALLGVTAVLTV
ncbi:HAD-IA family hydrolase [Streptomyces sp. TRM76323]|uniref:HAD-IA family hydrolase n=1 Tax=Streptomyces tamarix TaxID=3078565 RepID=A0ABU3QUB9_9ACTN|nr:HAD-IA family hydrolase [Streptomyces tamarix]MDT9686352.1 HAD-IA family hydrolase [Streptomyces tamarix]